MKNNIDAKEYFRYLQRKILFSLSILILPLLLATFVEGVMQALYGIY